MAGYGNPFGATAATSPSAPAPASNPFDPFAAPTPSASSGSGQILPQQQHALSQYSGMDNQEMNTPQTGQIQQCQHPSYLQQPQPQGSVAIGYFPTQQHPYQQQQQQQQQQQVNESADSLNQMVISSQQSNPYAGYGNVSQDQQHPHHQAMIPVQQQPQSQWGIAATPVSASKNMASHGNPFDPFAPSPPPPPSPAPVPVAYSYPEASFATQVPAPAPPSYLYPTPSRTVSEHSSYPAASESQMVVAQTSSETYSNRHPYQSDVASHQGGTDLSAVQADEQGTRYDNHYDTLQQDPQDDEQQQQQQQYLSNYNDRQIVPAPSTAIEVKSAQEVRNKYSHALAQQAGSMASPLPKAELVRKKGYVLSRISFRTIVMKKWKQSFWIQYGSHTMLWFRNESDFDDWLNNPYHTQAQRNFLIKLAVNFVHDLYKPNVRGYQVTQCRTKPYGNKVVRQFKLERWMDYGPTIAAAFGSYDPKEVDACREAIVECMKNTPLDNGIRATGAVKEHHEKQQAAAHQQQLQQQHQQGQHQRQHAGDDKYQNYQLPQNGEFQMRRAAQSVDDYGHRSAPGPSSQSLVSATDLLGDQAGFDDSASVPPAATTSNVATGDLLGEALVPATNPNSYYPGAPQFPYSQTQQHAPETYALQQQYQHQQPGYSGGSHQQSWQQGSYPISSFPNSTQF